MRCEARGQTCSYPGQASRSTNETSPQLSQTLLPIVRPAQLPGLTNNAYLTRHQADRSVTRNAELESEAALDFSNLDLICTINANDIRNRWLKAYLPTPEQQLKQYPPIIMTFMYRILKSYTAMLIHGTRIPPYIHHAQMSSTRTSTHLERCFTMARICDAKLPEIAREILPREMEKLYAEQRSYNFATLLSAFQAYLSYAMILFFVVGDNQHDSLSQPMMVLQEMACTLTSQGIVSSGEAQNTLPKWESWIMMEALRRSIYTMYLFDSVLCAHDGQPTFLGTELRGLPAPAAKILWEGTDRMAWKTAYHKILARWTGGQLRIDELWPIPAEMTDSEIDERRRRVDMWLESVDEYGTSLYAITAMTHGS